jgi:hypothetical protein
MQSPTVNARRHVDPNPVTVATTRRRQKQSKKVFASFFKKKPFLFFLE